MRRLLFEGLPRIVAVALCVFLLVQGWKLRQWTFQETAPVRFKGDITNGLHQGGRVVASTDIVPVKGERVPLRSVYDAWVKRYDTVYAEGKAKRNYSLDYTPLRLMVMSLWAREVWSERGQRVWNYDDTMAGPLMAFNAALTLAAAVAMFLLVRHWLRRAQRARGEPARKLSAAYATWRGSLRDWHNRNGAWVWGLIAAGLVWFNGAALIDAHAFPQWDVWLLPFFLGACYAGSRNAWTIAGFLLVIGAMLKGQLLIAAPVLMAWPLLSGNLRGVLRLGLGFALGIAVVVWPWLVRDVAAWRWTGIAGGAMAAVAVARWALIRPRRMKSPDVSRWRRWAGKGVWWAMLGLVVMAAAVAVIYPVRTFATPAMAAVAGLLAVAIGCLLWRPWRSLPYVLAGCFAFGVLLAGWQMGGSWSWYKVGFEFPTDHYQTAAAGTAANLPAILQAHYGWQLKMPMFQPPWATEPWTLQVTMRAIYFALLVPIAIMLPWHARRADPRALLCLAAPWVLMFALVPQMHERYLVWGAVVTAMGIAVSMGMALAHVAVTFIAFACVAMQILYTNAGWWPQAVRFFQPMIPNVGWATVVLAGMYWAACLVPPRKRQPRQVEANVVAAGPAQPAV